MNRAAGSLIKESKKDEMLTFFIKLINMTQQMMDDILPDLLLQLDEATIELIVRHCEEFDVSLHVFQKLCRVIAKKNISSAINELRSKNIEQNELVPNTRACSLNDYHAGYDGSSLDTPTEQSFESSGSALVNSKDELNNDDDDDYAWKLLITEAMNCFDLKKEIRDFYYCGLCNARGVTKTMWDQHVKGKKHVSRCNLVVHNNMHCETCGFHILSDTEHISVILESPEHHMIDEKIEREKCAFETSEPAQKSVDLIPPKLKPSDSAVVNSKDELNNDDDDDYAWKLLITEAMNGFDLKKGIRDFHYCGLCDARCVTKTMWDQHVKGKKHVSRCNRVMHSNMHCETCGFHILSDTEHISLILESPEHHMIDEKIEREKCASETSKPAQKSVELIPPKLKPADSAVVNSKEELNDDDDDCIWKDLITEAMNGFNLKKETSDFYYCGLCNVRCLVKNIWDKHIEGKRHASRCNRVVYNNMRCETCGLNILSDGEHISLIVESPEHRMIDEKIAREKSVCGTTKPAQKSVDPSPPEIETKSKKQIDDKACDENVVFKGLSISPNFVLLNKQIINRIENRKKFTACFCRPCDVISKTNPSWMSHLSSPKHVTLMKNRKFNNVVCACLQCDFGILASKVIAIQYMCYHIEKCHDQSTDDFILEEYMQLKEITPKIKGKGQHSGSSSRCGSFKGSTESMHEPFNISATEMSNKNVLQKLITNKFEADSEIPSSQPSSTSKVKAMDPSQNLSLTKGQASSKNNPKNKQEREEKSLLKYIDDISASSGRSSSRASWKNSQESLKRSSDYSSNKNTASGVQSPLDMDVSDEETSTAVDDIFQKPNPSCARGSSGKNKSTVPKRQPPPQGNSQLLPLVQMHYTNAPRPNSFPYLQRNIVGQGNYNSTPINNTCSYGYFSPSESTKRWNMTHYPICNHLFIGNIPANATDHELWTFFGRFGAIVNIQILPHDNTRTKIHIPKCGFIIFEAQTSVKRVLMKMPIRFPNESGNILNIEMRKPRTRM